MNQPVPQIRCMGKAYEHKADKFGCGSVMEYIQPPANPAAAEYYCKNCHISYKPGEQPPLPEKHWEPQIQTA